MLVVLPPEHPAAQGPATSLAGIEHAVWAAGHRGSGHSAVINHLCNRLGGYAPVIGHRSDDALILRALVASGRAVTLLPALIATDMPDVAARPISEAPLQRTIFTAARSRSAAAPAISAARDALRAAALAAASGRRDVHVLDAG